MNVAGNVLTALAAILATERTLLKLLKEVDPDDLYRLMQSGQPFFPEQFMMLVPFYRNNPEAFKSHYSVEYILKKVREVRPDLWTLITACPEGVEWLKERRTEVIAQLS